MSWILSASALKMEGENRETGGDIQERCTIKVHLESSSNHCDFQTPVPPAPGRMQLAMDNFCEGNVAQSAMNDRTEPFLRCSDLRVISGCHLCRDTDDNRRQEIRIHSQVCPTLHCALDFLTNEEFAKEPCGARD